MLLIKIVTKGKVTEIQIESRKYGLKTVIIDTADLSLVKLYSWYIEKCKSGFYAASKNLKGKSCTRVRMHRLLSEGRQVDHKNGNGLDNRRKNLRPCTQQQNNANQKKTRGTSKFKVVCRIIKGRHKWQAGIKINGTRIALGRFNSEIDAAKAYDSAAIKLFGEFARINFQDQPGQPT